MLLSAPVAPLAPHTLLVFLLQVALLLALAFGLGRLAGRARLPAVVGELFAGVLVGPSVLGHLAPGVTDWLLPADPQQIHLLDAVGQIGVLLLVGLTGAQLDPGLLRRRGATAVRVSVAGLLVPLGLGIALGHLLPATLIGPDGNRTVFAMFIGVAMCVSAIPVIAKTLTDMKLIHRDVGQLTLAAGMVDDAVGWLLLSVVSVMAAGELRAGRIVTAVLILLGFVAVMLLMVRPPARALLRRSARGADPAPTVAITVLVMLLGAATTQALGMEPIFGAFVAGLVVGSAYAPRLAPLRTVVLAVLAPLFVATAGLRMDLGALRDPRVLLAALAALAVAIAGKFAGAYLGALSSRLSRWEALALGSAMNARGVVEVVVASVGLRLGVLNVAAYTVVVLIAIVTSVMAPPLLRFAMARVEYNADERLREQAQREWDVAMPDPARGPAAQ